jgi:hypothetical protein
MVLPKRVLNAAFLFLSFLIVAAVQSWPLPVQMTTHLTGNPGGDTGVYVWNTWVFAHEAMRGSWPFSTTTVLAGSGPVDLSLHNYTVFSDLLALPLQTIFGVVATFNLVYLLNVALAGVTMVALVRHVGGPRVRTSDAWLAGFVWACSPFLVARSTAHFSLVAVAPLPLFALFFDRSWQRQSVRDALLAGVCLAWAAFCDVYFAVYCVLLGTLIAAVRVAHVRLDRRRPFVSWTPGFDVPLLLMGGAVVISLVFDGRLNLGPVTVSMRSAYTPVLLLTLTVIARAWWIYRPRCAFHVPPLAPLVRPALALVAAATVLLWPMVYGVALQVLDGRMVSPPVLWRSSAPGVDLVSFFLPNPNHPLVPQAIPHWVMSEPGRFEENVASIPWVVFAVIVVAWTRAAFRPERLWMAAALGFGSLALGPFIRIAGIETYIPTPWTLLRYVPVVSEARMPSRFAVLVIMAVAVIFAAALAALRAKWPRHQKAVLAFVAVVLCFELLPIPRRLDHATVPPVYDVIAADQRRVTVLNLPLGIRDGLSSFGNFTADTLFFQAHHGKPIVGGYLSRVSPRRRDAMLADPTMAALVAMSEHQMPDERMLTSARQGASAFLSRLSVGWVVVDESFTPPALQAFATDVFGLREVARSGAFVLYEPAATTN